MTWHENHVVAPGVPDLSYVMVGSGYETGWLELKAVRAIGHTEVQFKVEPSQHGWIEDFCHRVPVHFLLAVNTSWFLFGGDRHHQLADPIEIGDLARFSCARGEFTDMRQKLSASLRELTYRQRV